MPTTQRGFDAIQEAWGALHPGVQPTDARLGLGTALGGPIDGVLAYPLPGHWLLIGYGLSELGDKETSVPELSGCGFELTSRVVRQPDTVIPPQWMIQVMTALARAFLDGTELDVGDWIVTPGPLGDAPEAGPLTSVAIVPDTELSSTDTPNGRVHFWQVVGLTAAEGAVAQQTGTAEPIITELRRRDPLLTTDPARPAVY